VLAICGSVGGAVIAPFILANPDGFLIAFAIVLESPIPCSCSARWRPTTSFIPAGETVTTILENSASCLRAWQY
jgi:hypothetical protein